MPTHRYVTNGVERSRSAWYCLCILEVCAETAAKGVWSGSVASIVYSVRVLDSRRGREGGAGREATRSGKGSVLSKRVVVMRK